MEVPKELINELKDPNRKRSVKTIIHENWALVEQIDNCLKKVENEPKMSILVFFMFQNFMALVNLMVNPKRRNISKKVQNGEIQEFEEDLRNAQRNWKFIFQKYEEPIGNFVRISKNQAKMDFHGELWQKTQLQKIASIVYNFSECVHNRTVSLIPPSRYLFNLVNFVASWTLIPVFNFPKKLTNGTRELLYSEKSSNKWKIGNGKSHKENGTNGTNHVSSNWIPRKAIIESNEFDETFTKFHLNLEESGKMLSEKEHEWNKKSDMFHKEIYARLEVQEKRLQTEIEKFEEEKEERRREEEESYRKIIMQQNENFEKIIKKIEDERKQFSESQIKNIEEICEDQNNLLLDLFKTTSSFPHWEDHEEFWSNRLHLLRSSLSLIRSEFWSFESYLKQHQESHGRTPGFVNTIYKMESASFGRTVTRAQTLFNNELEFFETIIDRYADDLFLRVIWKATNKIAMQLENVIVELWSVAVNEEDFDVSRLCSSILQIDPYSIPTTWRLKGICHSVDPIEYEEVLSCGSNSVNGHF